MFRLEGMGNSTFLVYDTEEEKVDTLGLGMLSNNTIDGLLKFSCVRKDESIILNYDVTAMIPLKQYFESYLQMDQVIHIFRSIVGGIISAEEYMLDIGKLMLDGEHIYIEVKSGNCSLLYLPAAGAGQEPDLVEVFKRLLLEIRYDAQSDNAYMTEMINYLNSSPKLDCRKFGQWLSESQARKEHAEASVHRVVPSGPANGFRQQETVAGKEGTEINPPEIPLVRTAMNGNAGKPQEEKKKGLFPSFGGKGKEEKKEEKRPDSKQDKKLEKKQEKEEKKQEKLREKQMKREAKKSGKNNGKGKEAPKASGVNPYFAIPGQKRPDSPGAGMAVPNAGMPAPGAVQPVSNAGMAIPNAGMGAPNAGMAIPSAGMGAPNAGMAIPNAGRQVPESPAGASREENRYGVRDEGRMGLDFGDTVVMEEEEDSSTVIISSQMQIADGIPYLKRVKNGQKMYIDKPLIKIGREGKYVDFYIGDNPSVSRSHADIIRENDAYYIRDNNSSNHTYVESEMLTGGQKVKLWHGAKIRISDEEFVFYMY